MSDKTKPEAATEKTEKTGPLLTKNETRVLELLSDGKERSRKEMAEALKINKGWSKLLGAAQKGTVSEDSLEGRGLVKHDQHPTEKGSDVMGPLVYTITKLGKSTLEAHKKAEAKKEKDEADKAAKSAAAKEKAEKAKTEAKAEPAKKPVPKKKASTKKEEEVAA